MYTYADTARATRKAKGTVGGGTSRRTLLCLGFEGIVWEPEGEGEFVEQHTVRHLAVLNLCCGEPGGHYEQRRR